MSDDLDRRTVLTRIGAATTSLAALAAGSAAASSGERTRPDGFAQFASDATTDVDAGDRAELVRQYGDPDAARAELAAAVPVLEALAADGHLESASLAPFAVGGVREGTVGPADAGEGVGVTALDHEEGPTARLMVTTPSADHRVSVARLPERDATYAHVETDDGPVVYHDFDAGVVTTSYCTWVTKFCTGDWCDFGDPPQCTAEQHYCCYDYDLNETCYDVRWQCGCACD